MIVGSGNLTGGGFKTNYEADVMMALKRNDPVHSSVLAEVEQTLDEWSTPGRLCLPLTDTLLEQLHDEGFVEKEAQRRERIHSERKSDGKVKTLFGYEPVPPAPKSNALQVFVNSAEFKHSQNRRKSKLPKSLHPPIQLRSATAMHR